MSENLLASYLKRLVDQQAQMAKKLDCLCTEVAEIRKDQKKSNALNDAVPEDFHTYIDSAFNESPPLDVDTVPVVAESPAELVPVVAESPAVTVPVVAESPAVPIPISPAVPVAQASVEAALFDGPPTKRVRFDELAKVQIKIHSCSAGECTLCGNALGPAKRGFEMYCGHMYHYNCAQNHFNCVKRADCPACADQFE